MEIDPRGRSRPGIGLNLSDHPACGAVYLASREDSLFGAMNPANLASLEAGGRGPPNVWLYFGFHAFGTVDG